MAKKAKTTVTLHVENMPLDLKRRVKVAAAKRTMLVRDWVFEALSRQLDKEGVK